MNQPQITSEQFRRACGLWATGVSIVTTCDGNGRPFGLPMNAVTSLSLDPPMFIVCVDNGSDTLKPMLDSRVFCVNVLTQAQKDLSNRFSKKGPDKFVDVAFSAGVTGAPVLGDTLVSIECAVSEVLPGGDHQIFCGVARHIVTNAAATAEPLLYFGGKYGGIARD